jgi:uncharacterized protein (DUF934 family)
MVIGNFPCVSVQFPLYQLGGNFSHGEILRQYLGRTILKLIRPTKICPDDQG